VASAAKCSPRTILPACGNSGLAGWHLSILQASIPLSVYRLCGRLEEHAYQYQCCFGGLTLSVPHWYNTSSPPAPIEAVRVRAIWPI